ncbi:MAG TPA: hypothetical protein ENL06_01205 [Candidatus Portnoybacteria bacterium]|nr:hypothetical protein [Candidatus Portnoybacteria bacterium]
MSPDFPWKNYLAITFLVGLFVLGLGIFQFFQQKQTLRVVFLNVGEGNAVLIQNYGQNILIGGGPDKTILEKLDQFIPFYRRKLDLVISLSPRKQSLTGLISVVKSYSVDKILNNCENRTGEIEEYWWQEIKSKDTLCLWNKMIVNLDNGNYLQILILPKQNKRREGVVWLKLGSKTFLFSSGICQNDEKWLISNFHQPIDIWQVPRQGIKGAIIPEFLKKFKLRIAIIQSGQSRFKKINWGIIKMLEENGVDIKRTDLDGDIVLK